MKSARFVFVALLFWGPGTFEPANAESPNVLFIAVDDMNDWVSVFGGHPDVKTPNLERFCRSGAVVFQNAYCAGPVCGPSRSALLSGFMPNRTGLYGNAQNMLRSPLVQAHATLPEYFSKHGYVSKSMGKIFHRHASKNGSDSGHWAFDHWYPTQGGSPVDRDRVTSRNRNLIHGKPGPKSEFLGSGGSEFAWGPTVAEKEQTRDFRTALWAAEQLNQTHDKPLFLAVGLSKPHLPFYVPQEFFDLYDPATVQANSIREDDLEDIRTPGGKQKFTASDDYLWLKQNGLIDEAAIAYLAACSYADACLGVIFDALDKSPLKKNTIVVVWGDHGWHLGEKLRYRKATGWRESTRVPLMIRTPEMTQRVDCEGLVNLIDLYPTLVDYCHLPEKPELDGRSFTPLLAMPSSPWGRPTTTIFGNGNASIHDARWHYIRHRDGTEEFYDLKTDPMEWTNRVDDPDPDAKAARERLAARFPASFAETVASPDPREAKKMKQANKGLDRTIKPNRPLDQLK